MSISKPVSSDYFLARMKELDEPEHVAYRKKLQHDLIDHREKGYPVCDDPVEVERKIAEYRAKRSKP